MGEKGKAKAAKRQARDDAYRVALGLAKGVKLPKSIGTMPATGGGRNRRGRYHEGPHPMSARDVSSGLLELLATYAALSPQRDLSECLADEHGLFKAPVIGRVHANEVADRALDVLELVLLPLLCGPGVIGGGGGHG
jgi:hypothetical protein